MSAAAAAAASASSSATASATATLQALKARNAALKAELAALEKLASKVDSKDAKAKVAKKVTDTSAMKESFDHFDADGSGFIDKAEFAQLADSLGELLDDDELSAAVKEIDKNGDGKISFNEFARWWAGSSSSTKSAGKTALLKAKLKTREFKAAAAPLIRQLSAIKSPAGDAKELVKHRIAINVGEVKDAKSSVDFAVTFGPLAQSDSLGAPSIMKLTFAVKKSATAASIESEKKNLDELLSMVPLPTQSALDMKKGELVVVIGAPEDPFAIAQQLGLDLGAFIKELSLKLALGCSVADLVDGKEGAVAELLAAKLDLNLQFRKALLHTIGQTVPAARDAAFAGLLENFNLALNLGNAKDYLTGCLPPDGVDLRVLQANPQTAGVAMMAKVAQQLLNPGAKAKVKEFFDAHTAAAAQPPFNTILKIAAFLEQPTQVLVHTGSGVILTANMNNFLPLSILPKAD